MTYEQRLTAAKLLAGKDGIVCFVADGECALTCGLESANGAEIMTALSAMYNAVVQCTNDVYNTINGTKLPREHAEKLLSMLSAVSVVNGDMDMSIRLAQRG